MATAARAPHTPREPWVPSGGTSYFFVTDGIERALNQARNAAGDLDVRIAGGAGTIRQYLKAGVVDDATLHVAPALMERGVRIFDGMLADDVKLEPTSVLHSALVAHQLSGREVSSSWQRGEIPRCARDDNHLLRSG